MIPSHKIILRKINYSNLWTNNNNKNKQTDKHTNKQEQLTKTNSIKPRVYNLSWLNLKGKTRENLCLVPNNGS